MNHSSYNTLRLILGDQLNASHSWFKNKDDSVLYVIMELPQEQEYVWHHGQKIAAFFLAMEQFAKALAQAGHQVLHLTLDDVNSDLPSMLQQLCAKYSVSHFQYQRPDEVRLVAQLDSLTLANTEIHCVDSEHFYVPFDELHQHFEPDKHHLLESFYRRMRKRFFILMDGDKPRGGKWNFDQDNRNKLKSTDIKALPEPLCFGNDIQAIKQRLQRHQIEYFGELPDVLLWPVNRKQALELLRFFCRECLPRFGQFQDAMTDQSSFQWSLYHSRLSFALNAKILSPAKVVDEALQAFELSDGAINLAQIEGFVRQILGWREYVRGIYWANHQRLSEGNFLAAEQPLPKWYWDGNTKMNCLSACIKQSLKYAYAHHIQRLMITGNFALIAGLQPQQVEDWYLGIYIDAIEWVEQPNTRAMALFSDGGLIATKPYAASGNYVNKMSDYCKSCDYKVSKKTGKGACPLNSLYWHFLIRNKSKFENNPRMAFPYRSWAKMSEQTQQETLQQAEMYLSQLESL